MSPHDKHDKPAPVLPDSVFQMFRLDGKVAIVTGAGGGMGYEICRAYAEAGAEIAMWYNSSDKAIKMAEDLTEEYKVKAKAYKVPLTESVGIKEGVAQVVKDFGHVDIVVGNAGMVGLGPVADLTDDTIAKVMKVNLLSNIWLAREVGPLYKAQGSGIFIATSSISARIVNHPDTQALYNTTKAGLTHFIKSLAFDWKDYARCNIVSPGFFDTHMGAQTGDTAETNRYMTVMARQGTPKELKGIFLLLASQASTYMTGRCRGSDVLVDGGYTLV